MVQSLFIFDQLLFWKKLSVDPTFPGVVLNIYYICINMADVNDFPEIFIFRNILAKFDSKSFILRWFSGLDIFIYITE